MMIGMITRKTVFIGGMVMLATAETVSSYVKERKLENKRRKKINELIETIDDNDIEIDELEKMVERSINEMKDRQEAARAKKEMDDIEKRIEEIKKKFEEIENQNK